LQFGNQNGNVVTAGNMMGTGAVTDDGELNLYGAMTFNNNINGTGYLNASNYVAETITLNGVISGSVTVVADNSGTLILTHANTYTGGTEIVASSTVIGEATNAFGNGYLSPIAGNMVELDGFNENVTYLQGGGSITNSAAGNATLNIDGSGSYFNGSIADGIGGGSLSLSVNSSGTQILKGSFSYTGDTTISSGTLTLFLATTIASPLINVESGGTFNVSQISGGFVLGGSTAQELAGTGKIIGNVTVGAHGTLSPGDALGLMNVTGNVVLSGTLALQIDDTSAPTILDTSGGLANDELIATGSLTEGGTLDVTYAGDMNVALTSGDSFQLISAGSFFDVFAQIDLPELNSGLQWNTSQLATKGIISVIPEPGSLAILGMGAVGMMLRGRRRNAPKRKTF